MGNLHGNQCECTACGERFRVVSTFDAHRIGDHAERTRRCLTEQEMQAKGWSRNDRGLWRTAPRPGAFAR